MRQVAAALLLLFACARGAQRTRVIAYKGAIASRGPAFLQWDTGRRLGWSLPNNDAAWAGKKAGARTLGYYNGSLYLIAADWNHILGWPDTAVKRVSLRDGSVSEAADLLYARQWPGNGQAASDGSFMYVCGGRHRPADGEGATAGAQPRAPDGEQLESSCEVGDGTGWTYVGLPYYACGLGMAAAADGRTLGDGFAVSGGQCANGTTSDQVLTIDGPSGRFGHLPSMNKPRWAHSMAALGGALVVCGGEVDEDRDSWKCERLEVGSPAAGWEYLPDMPMNAAAVDKPAAYARQVAALDADNIIVLMSDGSVLFWSDAHGWRFGPALPYSGDKVALAVIIDYD